MMQIPVAASCSLFMLMLLVNRYINLCSAFSQHHDEAFSLKDDMQTHDMSKGAKAPKNEIQLSASHGKEANVFWENLNLTNEKHQHVQPIKWMLPHEHNNTQKNSVFSHGAFSCWASIKTLSLRFFIIRAGKGYRCLFFFKAWEN